MRARYLEDSGERIVLRPAADDAYGLGVFFAFVVAPCVMIGATLGAYLAFGDDPAWLAAGWAAGVIGALVFATIGLVRIGAARGRAERGEIRIDLAERLLEREGVAPEVLSGIERVVVRRVRGLFTIRWRLEIEYDDARRRMLLEVPGVQGGPLAEAAEHLADAIGVDADVDPTAYKARTLAARDPRLAAAMTYVPIDGLFAAIALWFLMTSTDPFVRFHAKQSLAHTFVEGMLAMVLLGCCGAPLVLVFPAGGEAAGVGLAFALFLAIRVAVRVTATLRAHAGAVWIMPWLGPLARRWAPRKPSKHGPAEA